MGCPRVGWSRSNMDWRKDVGETEEGKESDQEGETADG